MRITTSTVFAFALLQVSCAQVLLRTVVGEPGGVVDGVTRPQGRVDARVAASTVIGGDG